MKYERKVESLLSTEGFLNPKPVIRIQLKYPDPKLLVESDIYYAVYVVESESYCVVYLNWSPIKENIFRFFVC